MTVIQQLATIGIAGLATLATRVIPFVVFSEKRQIPRVIEYLGSVLPLAIFALLVVYCLKDVSFVSGNHGIIELISVAITVLLHLYKRNMLLSIVGGTACYMLLGYLL